MLTWLKDRVLNSDLTAIQVTARKHVRLRLLARQRWNAADVIRQCQLLSGEALPARALLAEFASTIGVDAGVLRPSDIIGAILTVEEHELGPGATLILEHHGVNGGLQVFAYDILHMLQTVIDRKRWEEQAAKLSNPPRDEEGWMDLVMAMTLEEFLSFFVATLPDTGETSVRKQD